MTECRDTAPLSLQNAKILDSKWNLPILTKWLVKRLVNTGWRHPQSSSCNCFLSRNVRFSLPLWAGNSYLWWTYISCPILNRLNDEFLRHRSQVHVVYMFLKSCKPSSLLIVFMKVLIRNCLSLVIPFRYAKLYQKTLMIEDTKDCTSILSRYFWEASFYFWGHNNMQGGSTHPWFSDLVMFTVIRKKFMDQQEYTFNLSFISYRYKFAIIVSKAFSFFWLFLILFEL